MISFAAQTSYGDGWITVLHGEILARDIRAHLGAPRHRVPTPRARPLCLLDTADGRAIVRWGPISGRSRLAGWLKRRRDRRFVEKLGSE